VSAEEFSIGAPLKVGSSCPVALLRWLAASDREVGGEPMLRDDRRREAAARLTRMKRLGPPAAPCDDRPSVVGGLTYLHVRDLLDARKTGESMQ